jgi:D-alanine--poly(phosphoribitol) ligase subunit 1
MTTLSTLLRENAKRNPDRLALSVAGQDFSYCELLALVWPVANWLRDRLVGKSPRVGILASRSWAAYAGILATSSAGGTYVPIHPDCPEDRILRILSAASLDALIVDDRGIKALSPTVAAACPKHVLAPANNSAVSLHSNGHGIAILGKDSLPPSTSELAPVEPDASRLAYIMFTSGTTGSPKGVIISEGNVSSFLSAMQQHFSFQPSDRVPQTFEFTFDLSVWAMLAAWGSGGSLHVVPAGQLMGPSGFIREKQLTVWLSVPSTISCMRSLKMLTTGAFPSLRYSGFCGEPLPAASAEAWRQAAPNSIIANVYGPTEATIACLAQVCSDPPVTTKERNIVAIGKAFSGMKAAVVDSSNNFLPAGETGELALSGPQIASGYLNEPTRTAARFPTINGEVWYLTGDLAYQDAAGIFHHLGRTDNQVKVLGNRVELEEVEAHLRDVCETESVAALPWPIDSGSARGIVAFVAGTTASPALIRKSMQRRVPTYMVPSQVRVLDDLPHNTSGKTDRNALAALLSGGGSP